MLLSTYSKTDSFVQLLTLVVIFVFVILITYFTVRFTTRIQQGQSKCSNIEVIETKKIGANQYLQIVRAGEKYLLIGIGKDEVNMISELNSEELILRSMQSDTEGSSFADIMGKIKNLNKKNED